MPRVKRSTRGHARPNPTGVLQVAAGGYGFVETPEGEYFVPASKMGDAFDGDTVEVKPVSVNYDRPQPGKAHNAVGKKPTARVVGVVKRAHETLVGRYEIAEPFGVVIPEDSRIQHDIFTMHADNPHVHDGDVVRVRILQYPSRYAAATGVVEQVVGRSASRGVEIDAIVASHNLRTDFPPEALADAGEAQVDAERALRDGYADLRDRCIFTIDPPDARDFDDALSLDRVDGGWRLGVHIADVSWYVRGSSALDTEARLRATSVYLADRVVPMLPEALSNGVCSLAPGEDRRCVTVDVVLDESWDVRDVTFYPAIMRSTARLDYEQVQELFDSGSPQAPEIDPSVCARLFTLRDLSQALKRKRARAGALDLESSEVHMLLDDELRPIGYTMRRSTEATELVEQCMILANTLVAQALHAKGEPAIYRVHGAPDPASLAALVPILQEFDYGVKVDLDAFAAGNVRAIQQVLDESRGRQEAELVSMMLLRAMKRAAYADECEPHFGLAIDEYLHFTSPIRRYPDLVAHRALKRMLGVPGAGGPEEAGLAIVAEHASAMERTADEAAYESQSLKLVEYLAGFVGRDFDAVVSKVSTYGFFVRLDNTATGLVAAGGLGEPYSLDVRRQVLTGQDSGRTIRLGQRVRVTLVAARISSRELDFELAY